MKKQLFLAFSALVLLTAQAAEASPLKVFVSIAPQKYFVEKIGGDRVDVSILVPPGASPHMYEPKPAQMVALRQAVAYFAIGVDFEDVWLDKLMAVNPEIRLVNTDLGIEKIHMAAHHHHHGDEVHEEHKGLDPHIWTSPRRVLAMAETIYKTMLTLDPEHKAEYAKNYESFKQELLQLDKRLVDLFKDKNGMGFMVFHPSWGYLAADYGLEQIPVELEGKEPKPAELVELIEMSKKRGIRTIFVQPQMSTKSAETISRAIEGQVVRVDPLAEDWGRNLLDVAEKIHKSLR